MKPEIDIGEIKKRAVGAVMLFTNQTDTIMAPNEFSDGGVAAQTGTHHRLDRRYLRNRPDNQRIVSGVCSAGNWEVTQLQQRSSGFARANRFWICRCGGGRFGRSEESRGGQ